jgi:hypothetical protein
MRRSIAISFSLVLLALTFPASAQQRNSADDCNQGRAEYPKVDPRDLRAICLPEPGYMVGTIGKAKIVGDGEEFGRTITPVGDLDGDSIADFILTHRRCDTAYYRMPGDPYPQSPVELLLYRGVKGGLPDVRSGERIGPSEILSVSKLFTAGDFDGDGHPDLVIRIGLLGDTTYGNAIDNSYETARLVIFWGQPNGEFTLADTSRLECGTDLIWLGPNQGNALDVNHDGIDDLVLFGGGYGYNHGRVSLPKLMIFNGGRHRRWGRDGVPSTSSFNWWASGFSGIGQIIDQDCDGQQDLVLYGGDWNLSVLYGRSDLSTLDTTNIERINLQFSNGHGSLFEDVTGDGVPELILTCGLENRFKLFAGQAGQRLRQQYGPDSTPNTPWAEVWQASKLNPDWYSADAILNLGDLNLDGIGDLNSYAYPYIICYAGGRALDSLIDGLVWAPKIVGSVVRLGDIDGSGVPMLAYPYDDTPHDPITPFPGGIVFFKPSKEAISDSSWWERILPHPLGYRCEHAPASVQQPEHVTDGGSSLTIAARPNPSGRQVEFVWSGAGTGEAIVTIADVAGHEVFTTRTDTARGRLVWDSAGQPPGVYIAILRTSSGNAQCRVVLER